MYIDNKPLKHHEILIVIIMIIVITTFSYMNTYDIHEYIAYQEDNSIKVIIPYYDKQVFKDAYVLIKDTKYRIKDVKYSEITLIEDKYIYEVTFQIETSIEEEIFNIKVLNNKQRIYQKIKNIIKKEWLKWKN